jgi:hypothetical protein
MALTGSLLVSFLRSLFGQIDESYKGPLIFGVRIANNLAISFLEFESTPL